MSDLISRSALLEQVEVSNFEFDGDYDMDDVIVDIKRAPTAFDFDKVIAELQKLKTYKLDLADTMTEIMARGKSVTYICLEDVIELLKNNISGNAEPPKTD